MCVCVCVCVCVCAGVCVCVAKPVAVELRCHATALISNVFDGILFILAGNDDMHESLGNDDMHESLDEFKIWPDSTTDTELAALEQIKKIP